MAVATIRDLAQVDPWRRKLVPAYFKGALFHCEAGSREGGRRIVTHEFPKKEFPYSEDMGKRTIEWSVRGYCIQFVRDANQLYTRDYTTARDRLQKTLDAPGPGTLQLPLMAPMTVVCSRYRVTEEERLGGYCVFDMSFSELGAPPFTAVSDSYGNLVQASQQLAGQISQSLTPVT